MAEDRSIKVRLGAEFGDLTKQLDDAAKKTDILGQKLEASSRKVETARTRQRAAVEQVAAAERRLQEVQQRSNATEQQKKQASQEVANARRAEKAATESLTRAEKSHTELVNRATTATGRLAQSAQENAESWQRAGVAITAAGAAITAAVGNAIDVAANFDQSMSGVQAATMESAANMKLLRQAAIDAGADTQYSATESAAAITELGKAGLSATNILSGGLSGALDLAASDQIEVAKAAEITSAALTQFKLSGTDASHVADLLAAGAGKALGGVEDLGMALNQSGAVANSAGLSIEETTAALAAFAAAGTTGSDAGTSFKSMLQRLTPQSKEAEKMMNDLGISAFDAQGEFIGLAAFAGNLQDALSSLTPQQRQSAMATMFGSDAVRAATAIYNEGEAGIRKWEEAVNDSGYASRQAAIRTDNLKGDLERLGGSWETLMIGMGEGVNGPMRTVVQILDRLLGVANSVPGPIKTTTLGIAGLAGVTALAGGGFLALTPQILSTMRAMTVLQSRGGAMATTITRVGTVSKIAAKSVGLLATAGAALAALDWVGSLVGTEAKVTEIESMANAMSKFEAEAKNANGEVTGMYSTAAELQKIFTYSGNSGWGSAITNTELSVRGLSDAIYDLDTYGRGIGGLAVGFADFLGAAENPAKLAAEAIGNFDAALAQMVTSGNAEKAATFAKEFSIEAQNSGKSTEWVAEKLTQYNTALESSEIAAKAAAEAEKQASIERGQALGYSIEISEEAAKALEEWRSAVDDADASFISGADAYSTALSELEDSERARAEAAAEASASTTDSWEDFYDTVEVSAKDYIQQLEEQVAAQQNWEDNMITLAKRVNEGMTGEMQAAGNAMIDELLQLGPEGAEQVALLESMTDKQFSKVVKLWSNKGTAAVTEFTNKVESYRNPVINVEADLVSAEQALQNFISAAASQTVTIRARMTADPSYSPAKSQNSIMKADGGLVHFADGTENHIAQIAKPGDWRVWAEPETGGEAYIPLSPAKRPRSKAILTEVANRFGMSVYADGAVVSAKADRDKAKREAKAAADAQKSAQKAYDNIDSGNENRGKKKAAKVELDRAKAEAKRAQERLKRAEDALKLERERRSRRQDFASEFATANRRGEGVRARVNDGSGLSVVDEMFSWADSGAFSKARNKKLRASAKSAEKKLVSAYSRLEDANETFNTLASLYDNVRSGLAGGWGLSGLLGSTNAFGFTTTGSGKDIAKSAQAYAGKLKTLGGKLSKLRKTGASQALIEKIVELDTDEALQVADAFLADPGSASATSKALSAIDANANSVGLQVANGAAGAASAGLYIARGGELGSAAIDAISANIDSIGKSLAKAFQSAIDGKTPAKSAAKTTKKTAKKKAGKRASGGVTVMGQPYLVGEEGPELFVPGVTGTIVPSRLTIPAVQAASSAATTTVQQIDYTQLARAFAQEVSHLPVQTDLLAGTKFQTEVVRRGLSELARSGDPILEKVRSR